MTTPTPDALTKAGWQMLEADGFIAHVGPFWQKVEREVQFLGFLAGNQHRNRNGNVQGGMLATLADRGMGMASRLATGGLGQATIQLDMHYLDAARIGDFVEARCRVKRRTRHVVFVECELFSADRMVATADGIWKILTPP